MHKTAFVVATLVIGAVLVFARVAIDRSAIENLSIVGDLDQGQLASIKQHLGRFDENSRDADDIRIALLDLSWVKSVSIRREWPAGMSVEIQPETVMAYWNDDGFINSDGRVLVTDLLQGGDLPFLYGPEGTEMEVMSRYQQLGAMLKRHGHEILVLRRSERGSWSIEILSLETRDRLEVLLGKEDLRDRLDRFLDVATVLRRQVDKREIERMDARYINGVAVLFKNNKEVNLGDALATDSRNDINEIVGVRSL